MSEDEIIEEMKENVKCNEDSNCYNCPYKMQDDCFLDLYNNQKQQLTELQAIEEEHRKENGELRKENKKLSEELVEGICNKIDVEEFEKMGNLEDLEKGGKR